MRLAVVIYITCIVVADAVANYPIPPAGYTGGFGETTCLICHAGTTQNYAASLPASFVPGRSYEILVDSGGSYGSTKMAFTLSARLRNGLQAGDFTTSSSYSVLTGATGARYASGAITAGLVRVNWVAPASADEVVFNLAVLLDGLAAGGVDLVRLTQVNSRRAVGASATAFVNRATQSGAPSPGSQASIIGSNLAAGSDSSPAPATTLAGTSVTLNGFRAPLFSVSPMRIDVQVPWELLAAPSAAIAITTSAAGTGPPVSFPLSAFSPAITGDIRVCLLGNCISNQTTRAAKTGETVSIPSSGLGDVIPRPLTGSPSPYSPLARTVSPVRVHIGDASLSAVFSGLKPDAVGLYQVDFVVPNSTPLGRMPVAIEVDGVRSNTVFMDVVSGAPIPYIAPDGIVNAANYRRGPVAPGTIISLFGSNLSVESGPANTLPLPMRLRGASFQMGDWVMPIFYVSPTQANVQVPWHVSGATELPLRADLDGVRSQILPMVQIAAVSPGVFTIDQSGLGQGAVLISGTAMLAGPATIRNARPVRRGEWVEVFCVGLGAVTNTPASGAAALSDPLSRTLVTPAVTIGGIQAQVSFSGLAPRFVGLYQVNVEVPAAAASGSAVPLALTIGGVAANAVTIAVE